MVQGQGRPGYGWLGRGTVGWVAQPLTTRPSPEHGFTGAVHVTRACRLFTTLVAAFDAHAAN
eukprot:scaffold56013_cov67-Phaeocystis_antarctica.AAC.2